MKLKTSLFAALRSYRPRENHDPLENFITEAFAWLLINHPEFGGFYLDKVLHRLGSNELPAGVPIQWTTQVNLGGVYPDLVGIIGDQAYLFEHKAWSHLHSNQLATYRREATETFGTKNYRLILITGGRHQIDQDPDLGLCWHEVHAWISEWERHQDYQEDYLFSDFQRLLETEGMGPPAPISQEAILSYKPAQSFEPALHNLVQRVFPHKWSELFHPHKITPHLPWHRSLPGGKDPWGRFGINLLGDVKDWSPGLFLGFHIDPEDHGMEWLNPLCPDFGVIIDINLDAYPNYDLLDSYLILCSALKGTVMRLCPDYQFFNHLAHSTDPNKWHPLYIRKPMLEVLRGTIDSDEQQIRFIREASRIIACITATPEFWAFREDLQREKETRFPF